LLAYGGHAQKWFEGTWDDYLSLFVSSSRRLNRFLCLRGTAGCQEASNKAETYAQRQLQKEGRSSSGTLHGPNLRASGARTSRRRARRCKQTCRHLFQTIDLKPIQWRNAQPSRAARRMFMVGKIRSSSGLGQSVLTPSRRTALEGKNRQRCVEAFTSV
jgi:hypothetical protein